MLENKLNSNVFDIQMVEELDFSYELPKTLFGHISNGLHHMFQLDLWDWPILPKPRKEIKESKSLRPDAEGISHCKYTTLQHINII